MLLKKIYYVPGTISLLIVPFLLLHFIHDRTPKQEFALKLFLPKDEVEKNGLLSFNGQQLLEDVKPLKKTEINLDSDDFIKHQKLDFIFHEMQRLSFTNTREVLIVHMNENNSFDDFVRFRNMANIVQLKRFAFWKDEWYFVKNDQPIKGVGTTPAVYVHCGFHFQELIPPEPPFREKLKSKLVQLYENKSLYLMIGLITLTLNSIRRKITIR